jgi:predicted  nucleic acid-binding Zn-ribbon protein
MPKADYEALQKQYEDLRQVVLMHEESIKMKEMEAIKGTKPTKSQFTTFSLDDEKLLNMLKTIDSLREENSKYHKEIERLKKENTKVQSEWTTLNTAKSEAETKFNTKMNGTWKFPRNF